MAKLWGKYRGIVTSNRDPEHRKRLKVKCPVALPPADDGTDNVLDWALPGSASAGKDGIGDYMVPEVGSNVWIEFEQGDIDKPLWSGGWTSSPEDQTHAPTEYVKKENPPDPGAYWDDPTYGSEDRAAPTNRVIKTASGHILELDDESGQLKIRLTDSAGQEILMRSEPGRERIQITDKGGNHFLMDGVKKRIHAQDVGGSFFLLDGESGDVHVGAVRNLSLVAGENLIIGAGKDMQGTCGANYDMVVGNTGTISVATQLNLGGTGGRDAARVTDPVNHPPTGIDIAGGSAKVKIVD